MPRLSLAVAALLFTLAPANLWSQMRGGHAGSSFGRSGFSSGSSFRGSTFVGGGFGFAHGGFGRGGFGFGHRPVFFGNHGPFFHGPRSGFFFGAGFGYPYFASGFYPYGGYGYSYPIVVGSGPAYVSAPPSYYESSPLPQNYYPDPYYDRELRRDVDELHGKVDRLQRDVEAKNHPPSPRAKTVLVFKDDHIREVQNYAIVGPTIWILDSQRAEKLPLSSLDVDSTIKLNDERGIDFQIPR